MRVRAQFQSPLQELDAGQAEEMGTGTRGDTNPQPCRSVATAVQP